jgi:hypothetical protein
MLKEEKKEGKKGGREEGRKEGRKGDKDPPCLEEGAAADV